MPHEINKQTTKSIQSSRSLQATGCEQHNFCLEEVSACKRGSQEVSPAPQLPAVQKLIRAHRGTVQQSPGKQILSRSSPPAASLFSPEASSDPALTIPEIQALKEYFQILHDQLGNNLIDSTRGLLCKHQSSSKMASGSSVPVSREPHQHLSEAERSVCMRMKVN